MIIKSKTLKKLQNTGVFLFVLVLDLIGRVATGRAQGIDAGINVINDTIALGSDDPRVIAARIIQIFLSLLGVITVVLVIYAGALWMMSEGNEDKIKKARTLLKQAAIGLIIILSAWSITTFILNKLIGPGNPIFSEPNNTRHITLDLGLAALGNCSLESVYPAPAQTDVPRNTAILITFKTAINLSTVCTVDAAGLCNASPMNTTSISIYKEGEDNQALSATVSATPDKKTLVITPDAFLGSALTNTHYLANLGAGIKKDGVDESIFKTCAADYFKWDFTVSNKLDETPPKISGVFPAPDNARDTIGVTSAQPATGTIQIIAPQVYQAATILNISPLDSSMPGIDMSNPPAIENYHGTDSAFRVQALSPTKAQLFKGQTLLGAVDFSGRRISFPGYFSFSIANDPTAGNLWNVNITPEKTASTLTVGAKVYTFAADSNGNNIKVEASLSSTFNNTVNKINADPAAEIIALNPNPSGHYFTAQARVAGASGNNIVLSSNDGAKINVTALSGGTDGGQSITVKGKKDQPRNSVIQINFSEPINPLTISGTADELKDYLKIFACGQTCLPSEFGGLAGNGAECTKNSDCASYRCAGSKCQGSYLSGKFVPATNYKTVEFISDNECGMNGCGEKIFCLPPDSQIGVNINAADLFTCTGDKDCARFGAYKCSDSTYLDHKTCQTTAKNSYPLADLASSLKGLADLANNSLDGNGDGFAMGTQVTTVYKPFVLNAILPMTWGDGVLWWFYINNQIILNPPQILGIYPTLANTDPVSSDQQLTLSFNTLMMASTIRSGSETKTVYLSNTPETITHKFLNLWSQTPQPLGFWAEANSKDAAVNGLPLDGYPDLTDVYIKHSNFAQSVTYNAQAGSGLKDIYQNCYKPSSGPTCSATDDSPSCCFGAATSSLGLDASGNCK